MEDAARKIPPHVRRVESGWPLTSNESVLSIMINFFSNCDHVYDLSMELLVIQFTIAGSGNEAVVRHVDRGGRSQRTLASLLPQSHTLPICCCCFQLKTSSGVHNPGGVRRSDGSDPLCTDTRKVQTACVGFLHSYLKTGKY